MVLMTKNSNSYISPFTQLACPLAALWLDKPLALYSIAISSDVKTLLLDRAPLQLDGGQPLLDEYLSATMELFVVRVKSDLIRLSCQCGVGEVVSR